MLFFADTMLPFSIRRHDTLIMTLLMPPLCQLMPFCRLALLPRLRRRAMQRHDYAPCA